VELLTRWSREQCGRELARARRSSQRWERCRCCCAR
jgi:hypothetical protein